ncbi:MAG: DnaA ATPase domain-containing protein [bacterium]
MPKPLGELLINQRLITQNMLDQALVLQKQRQAPLGKILLQLGYVTEEDLNTILAKQFGSIYINPRGFVLKDSAVLELIPEDTARKYNCFPIELAEDHLTVAMSDPWNTQAIEDLTSIINKTIQPIFSRKEWIASIIDKYYATVQKKTVEPPPSEPTPPSVISQSETAPETLAPKVQEPQPKPVIGTVIRPPVPDQPAPSIVASPPSSEPSMVTVQPETIAPPPPAKPIPTPASQPQPAQPIETPISVKPVSPQPIVASPSNNISAIPIGQSSTAQPPVPQESPEIKAPSVTGTVPTNTHAIPTTLLTQTLPEFTFDNYVVGTGNQLAWAAAKNVAEFPGTNYNPLFIYGGVGLGKTHLMNAAGNLMLKNNPNIALMYIPCNRFIEEMITAISVGNIKSFREVYWHLQVFLIDDVQYLAGQERTQIELFQTFEELHHRKAQIILTCDRLPKDIPQLEERLRSRFEGGLIVDVQMPDLETRVAILRRKAMQRNLELPDDVTNVIATFVSTNVRELEGVLNKIAAISSLSGHTVTLQVVENILRDFMKQGR